MAWPDVWEPWSAKGTSPFLLMWELVLLTNRGKCYFFCHRAFSLTPLLPPPSNTVRLYLISRRHHGEGSNRLVSNRTTSAASNSRREFISMAFRFDIKLMIHPGKQIRANCCCSSCWQWGSMTYCYKLSELICLHLGSPDCVQQPDWSGPGNAFQWY